MADDLDLQHEAVVLAAAIFDPKGRTLVQEVPSPSVFRHLPHRRLFGIVDDVLSRIDCNAEQRVLLEAVAEGVRASNVAGLDMVLVSKVIEPFISVEDSRSALRILIEKDRKLRIAEAAAALAEQLKCGAEPREALAAFEASREGFESSDSRDGRFARCAEFGLDLWHEDVEPPVLLLGDFLERGGFGVLYGQPGRGKTFAALQLAVALVRGEDWFGIATTKCRVGFLSLELSRFYLRERLRAVAAGASALENLVLVSRPRLTGPVDLLSEQDLADLIALIRRFRLDVLIVDAFSRIHTADENSAKEIGAVLAKCDAIRTITGCAILLLHHERKTQKGSEGGSDLDALRGSSRLISDPTALLRLVESKGALSLRCAKVNIGVGFKEIFLLRRSDGTLVSCAAPIDPAEQANSNRAKVLDFLPDRRNDALALREVVAGLGLKKPDGQPLSGTSVRNYLQRLKAENRVKTVGKGISARWYKNANKPLAKGAVLTLVQSDTDPSSDSELVALRSDE